jgi:hypothetical protein
MEVEMRTNSQVLGIGFLFTLKFLSGIWLTRSSKPYNAVILAAHKIISVLTVVLIAVAVRHWGQDASMGAVEIGALIATGVLFLLTILSGGFLSTDRPAHAAILVVHRAAPFLTVLSTAVTIYLVLQSASQ